MCHDFFSEESHCGLILVSDHHPWATTNLRIFCGALQEVDSTQFFFLPSQRGDKSSSNKQNILVMSLFYTLVMIFSC